MTNEFIDSVSAKLAERLKVSDDIGVAGIRELVAEVVEEERRHVRQDLWSLSRAMRQKLAGALREFDPTQMTAADLAKWMKVCVEIDAISQI